MPPKKGRQELARQAAIQPTITPDIIAKRTKRHLDELERSNYAEPNILTGVGDEDEEVSNKYSKGRGRQTISDKRQLNIAGNSPASRKKKSTMNVRTALLYRKNLATLIEESHIASLSSNIPTYLTAVAPPSPYPPRLLCSVCGYWGRYKCRQCAVPYCDLRCEAIHAETRCERRVV